MAVNFSCKLYLKMIFTNRVNDYIVTLMTTYDSLNPEKNGGGFVKFTFWDTIAYNNLGIYYAIFGQDHYIDAVANFDKATKLDPVSIQIYRNLAWLQHAVTVDTDSAKIVYKNVLF